MHLRNKAGQSAYDVADSHLVRQYLLPLLLVAERNNGVVPQDYTPYGVPQLGPQTYHAPPGPPPPMAPLPPNSYNQQPAPSNNYPQPPYYPAPAAFSAPPSVPMAAAPALPPAPMPAAVASSSSTYSSHSTSSSNSNGRFIAPGNERPALFACLLPDRPAACRWLPLVRLRSGAAAEVRTHHRAAVHCSSAHVLPHAAIRDPLWAASHGLPEVCSLRPARQRPGALPASAGSGSPCARSCRSIRPRAAEAGVSEPHEPPAGQHGHSCGRSAAAGLRDCGHLQSAHR